MAIARLSCSLDIKCPKCKKDFDLISEGDNDDDGFISKPLFNNAWDKLKGEVVYCLCGHAFKIEDVEY